MWRWLRNKNNACRDCRAKMSAYLDSQASGREKRTLEEHISTCRECSIELDSLRATVGLLHKVTLVPAPRSFTIPAEARQARWFSLAFLRNAAAVAGVFLVVVLAVDFGNAARSGAYRPSVAIPTAPTAPASAPAAGDSAVAWSDPGTPPPAPPQAAPRAVMSKPQAPPQATPSPAPVGVSSVPSVPPAPAGPVGLAGPAGVPAPTADAAPPGAQKGLIAPKPEATGEQPPFFAASAAPAPEPTAAAAAAVPTEPAPLVAADSATPAVAAPGPPRAPAPASPQPEPASAAKAAAETRENPYAGLLRWLEYVFGAAFLALAGLFLFTWRRTR